MWDVYGFEVARITYKEHPNDEKVIRHYLPKLKEIMKEAGAFFMPSVPLSVQKSGGMPDTKHIPGTLRMGADPDQSVTDPYGKFHDLDNLYCADGGVFVTSTGYNPALTIQAPAHRQALRIVTRG